MLPPLFEGKCLVMTGADVERSLPHSRLPSGQNSRSGTRASSRKSSALSYSRLPFGFSAKTSHDASEDLTLVRSATFLLNSQSAGDHGRDIWRRPAPDFRPQVYNPRPPKRNSRDAVQPWKYTSLSEETEMEQSPQKSDSAALPRLFQTRSVDEDRFLTHFRILDPDGARMEASKSGYFPRGQYVMPKPHDFRGYPPIQSLGLPEFETAYERDPYNLKFRSQRLDIIRGLQGQEPTDRHITGRQMAPPLPAQPQWEARLILPKDQWPEKSMAYTRHRPLFRSPHSALMSRIEDTLNRKWAKERLDRELERSDCTKSMQTFDEEDHQTQDENTMPPDSTDCSVAMESV